MLYMLEVRLAMSIKKVHVTQFQFDHGPGRLANTLKKGLVQSGVELVSFSDAEYIAVLQWIDEHLNVDDFNGKRALLGPNIWEAPSERPAVANKFSDFIVPSSWVRDKHFTDPMSEGKNIHVWSGGIETDIWTSHDVTPDFDCFIYFKNRTSRECNEVIKLVNELDLRATLIEYGAYKESQLFEACQRSKFAILLTNTESQGYAYMQILSTGTPCIVLNKDHLVSRDGLITWPATSVPYFDERCGFIRSRLQIEHLSKMVDTYLTYSPRDYILENHTIEISTARYLEFLERV